MRYDILYSQDALNVLRALDKPVQIRIVKKILHLSEQPDLGKPLSNLLKNRRSIHVGKYRVLYEMHAADVLIVRIGHRKNVYE